MKRDFIKSFISQDYKKEIQHTLVSSIKTPELMKNKLPAFWKTSFLMYQFSYVTQLEMNLEMVEAFKFGPHGGHAYFPLIRTKFSPGNKLQTMEKHLKEGLNMAFLDLQRLKKTTKGSNWIKWVNKFVY